MDTNINQFRALQYDEQQLAIMEWKKTSSWLLMTPARRAELLQVHEAKNPGNAPLTQMRSIVGPQGVVLASEVLKVRDLTYQLDKIVQDARDYVSMHYLGKLIEAGAPPRIEVLGISNQIAEVSKRLNARGLEDVERALLALPALYEWLLIHALGNSVKSDDVPGLVGAVLRSVVVEPRRILLNEIVGRVLVAEKKSLDFEELTALSELAFERGINLRSGAVRADVLSLVQDGQRVGRLLKFVDRYAEKDEIDPRLLTASVKREMANFLYARGVRIRDQDAVDQGQHDEYFALAYEHATRVASGASDPVDVARSKGSVYDWDFTIRRISESDRPIIRAEAIRAAGALYTTFIEGEQMHVFDIADSLLTDWHRGQLDVPDGATAALLNRYEILMRDRPTEEERQMHYKRVFNIGEAQVLPGAVVNEAFPGLWDNLMVEVSRYIDKTERYYTEEKMISRAAMYQAIQDVQYNLSEYMTGSAPKKTTEMYKHLEEALDIIGSEDVLNHMGGRRKSVMTVIERVGKASLGVAIPTTNLVTVAERGNDIFQFIASFAAENVANDQFQRFLDACKAVIVSQAALEPRYEEDEYGDEFSGGRFANGSASTTGNRRQRRNVSPARRMAGVDGRYGGNNFDDWDS